MKLHEEAQKRHSNNVFKIGYSESRNMQSLREQITLIAFFYMFFVLADFIL